MSNPDKYSILAFESRLQSIVTRYDDRQSRKKNWSPSALRIYKARVKDVVEDYGKGANVREVIVAGFTGNLLSYILRAMRMSPPTTDEYTGAGRMVYSSVIKNMKHKTRKKRIVRRKRRVMRRKIPLRTARAMVRAGLPLRRSDLRGNPARTNKAHFGYAKIGMELLGTGLKIAKGERVYMTPATNIPGGGFFVEPAYPTGLWKQVSDGSILIKLKDFDDEITYKRPVFGSKSFERMIRANSGGRYRVGGGYQTFTLEEAKKEADKIFRKTGAIVSIQEHRPTPQVKPDYKYGIYTGRGIARNPMLGKYEQKALNFARKYPGFHGFDPRKPTANIIRRLEKKGLVKVSDISNQFRAV